MTDQDQGKEIVTVRNLEGGLDPVEKITDDYDVEQSDVIRYCLDRMLSEHPYLDYEPEYERQEWLERELASYDADLEGALFAIRDASFEEDTFQYMREIRDLASEKRDEEIGALAEEFLDMYDEK